ncbi:putative toxin-antitoxin system toxin component, PIN family [Duganella sp.]|uniref:putative toxin-antitoxin system toxin component, PIN family n=1 Tax=Duganella sp. TaxID=1904440 RepID=UPI0031E30564
MSHIVFDTNVLISAAIIPASVSRQALLHAVAHYQLVQSEATWTELTEVVARKKFDRYFPDSSRCEFMLMLARSSEFINVSVTISDCSDPTDNKFLELAVEAKSLNIVSGDNHLPDMHPYRGISVLTPAAFLRLSE